MIWLLTPVVLAIHDAQIAEHGGLPGVRDMALLHSALARPLNLCSYGLPDLADLTACYGYGISRNHPFNDGNKRTALVLVDLFLTLNGDDLIADDADCVLTMRDVAAGAISEKQFAAWIRHSITEQSDFAG